MAKTVNIDTFAYIHEENYIRQLLISIQQYIEVAHFTVKKIHIEKGVIELEYMPVQNLLFSCEITEMLKLFAESIFKKENIINYDKLMYDVTNKCKIIDERSIDYAVSMLNDSFSKEGLSIEWYGIITNKAIIKYQKKGYIIVELVDFINIHKNFLLFTQTSQ